MVLVHRLIFGKSVNNSRPWILSGAFLFGDCMKLIPIEKQLCAICKLDCEETWIDASSEFEQPMCAACAKDFVTFDESVTGVKNKK